MTQYNLIIFLQYFMLFGLFGMFLGQVRHLFFQFLFLSPSSLPPSLPPHTLVFISQCLSCTFSSPTLMDSILLVLI